MFTFRKLNQKKNNIQVTGRNILKRCEKDKQNPAFTIKDKYAQRKWIVVCPMLRQKSNSGGWSQVEGQRRMLSNRP